MSSSILAVTRGLPRTMAPARRGHATVVAILKGLITQVRILITQLRALTTLLITRGPLLVGHTRV